MTEVAVERLGVRVIEQTDRFTLLGADVRRGKLTLFDAEGPRERGPLARIGLRVTSLDGRDETIDLGEGLEIVLVEAETDSELDLDHVALVSADPAEAFEQWQALGFAPPKTEVGHRGPLPQHFGDRFGWPELVAEVARIYHALPPEDRARVDLGAAEDLHAEPLCVRVTTVA